MKLRHGLLLVLLAVFIAANTLPALAQYEQPLGQGGGYGYGYGGACTLYHTVRPGENLFRIGLLYGVQWTYLQSINYLPNPNWIYVGQSLCVRTGSPTPIPGRTYIVRYGDTLFGIASWYGYNVYTLASFNGIANINRIYAGQVLRLP
jgi:LysM repeat protein